MSNNAANTWYYSSLTGEGTGTYIKGRIEARYTRQGDVDTITARLVLWRNNKYERSGSTGYADPPNSSHYSSGSSGTASLTYSYAGESSNVEQTVQLWSTGTFYMPNTYEAFNVPTDYLYRDELIKNYRIVGNEVTFTVKHSLATTINLSSMFNWSVSAMGNANMALVLDLPATYTKPTAPTSLTISGDIKYTKPDDFVTIQWSGAAAGINNAISGYRIQYQIGAGDWTTVTVGSTATSGSRSIMISNGTRGSAINFKIATLGNTESGEFYTSDYRTYNGLAQINKLPIISSVTPSKTVVPSDGGVVTISFTGSLEGDNTQTLSYYYSNTASGTKTLYTAGGIEVVGSKPYYFWAYDGLEYSASYRSITLTKNTKPTWNSITPEYYTYKNDGVDYYYGIDSIAATYNNKTPTSFKYSIQYSNDDEYNLSTAEQTVSSIGQIYYDCRNLYSGIMNDAVNWRLKVAYSDGIEYSDYDTSVGGTIAGIGDISIYNGQNGTVSGSTASHFYKTLSFTHNNDTLWNNVSVTVGGYNARLVGNYFYIDQELTPAQAYTVVFTLSSGNFSWQKQETFTMIQSANPLLGTASQISYNPLTLAIYDTSTYNFNVGSLLTSETALNYDAVLDSCFTLKRGGGVTPDITILDVEQSADSTLQFTVNKYNIYPWAVDPYSYKTNGRYEENQVLNLQLTLTNVFGRQFIQQIPVTLNFVGTPTSIDTFKVSMSDGTNTVDITNTQAKIMASSTLTFAPTFTTYNKETFNYKIQINRGQGWVDYITQDALGNPLAISTAADGPNAGIVPTQTIQKQVGLISSAYTCQFRAIIVSSDLPKTTGITSSVLSYQTIKQDRGTINFTSESHTMSGSNLISNVVYTLTKGSSGSSTTSLSLYAGEKSGTITNNTATIALDSSQWTSLRCFIRVTEVTSQVIGTKTLRTTVIYDSNGITIFNIIPTVSPRKNHIGINCNNFTDIYDDGDDIIRIGEAQGRTKIVLISATKSSYATIGLPESDSGDFSIDGFVLDGGTW